MPTMTPTGTSTPLSVGPQVNWHVNLGASNGPVVEPISDVGTGQNGGLLKYDWWFFEDQYFEAEGAFRYGTFIDLSPFKKVFGITLGEYRESAYSADYYDYEGNISDNYENHYFEAGFTAGGGVNYKYNLKEDRFESFSLNFFGVSAEYSKQSSYQRQFYIGIDTGLSLGIGMGGSGRIKAGWRWELD